METVKRWLGNSWAFVLVGGILAVLAFPHLVSAYHLEAGGRAVDDPERLATDPLPALAHLQKVIEWRPDNAQAYRLLAKVYRTQGNWPAAVESLTRYTELRPDNPLGHIELAEVYEMAEAEIATMRLADLVAALPQAAVEAPDVLVDTPYVRPDGPAWHSYVATTAFSLPPNFGERPALFMHPPSRAFYHLTLPAEPALLRFAMGLAPEVTGWPGDGVTFEVLVNGGSVFQEHLDKALARQGWQDRAVDLSPWAGREVVLSLGVGPGPAGDVSGDWAGWGEPQVVDARLPELEALHPGVRLLDEWQRARLTADDFVDAGEEARKAGRYEEALEWCERAVRVKPDLQSAYFYLRSLALEALEEGERAIADLEQAISLDSGWLDQKTRFEAWFGWGKWLLSQQDSVTAEVALRKAIEIYPKDSEDVQPLLSEAYRFLGLAQWAQQKMDLAVHNMRLAVHWNDQNVWAHVHLAKTLYLQDREQVESTERELTYALDLHPEDVGLWVNLIQFWRWADEDGRAESLCNQAKEHIGPDTRLDEVCSQP